MKNFARLVQFAWPYRLRFALSVCCALMVALFFFTELGAVLPLLKIIFYSENPQRWITSKIDSIEGQIRILESQKDEVRGLLDAAKIPERQHRQLTEHHDALEDELGKIEDELKTLERKVNLPDLSNLSAELLEREKSSISVLRSRRDLVDASLTELRHGVRHLGDGNTDQLSARLAELDRLQGRERWWLAIYERIKPGIYRYLPSDCFKNLVLLIGLVMVGVALKGFFMFLQEVLVAQIMQFTQFDIRNLFFRRTLNLDLGSFSDQGSAELMARFTNDMDSYGIGLLTLLTKLVREPLRAIFCLCGAFWFNWRLTCLTLIVVPISALTTYRVGRIMKRAVRRSLESMSSIYKILQESFQGIRVVKAFAMERIERRRFFIETKNLLRKSIRVSMIDAMSDPVLEMLTLVTVAVALLAGSYLVLKQQIFLDLGLFKIQLASQTMAIEDLLTLYAILGGVSDPIRKLSNVHSKLQRAAAASDRICALMDRRPQVIEHVHAPDLPAHRKSIVFEGVHFSYPGRPPLLRGIDLTVAYDETIALVGPNGCGKTTLMGLLPRFYDLDEGSIRIDDRDIRDFRIRSLRRQIGIVPQETILFQDTIARNIAYGDPSASRDAIMEAAKRAFAHQFIASLPDGYDTIIGERGHGLSGGQKQRIALARAMLLKPSILILDEATSAVDIQDEALIRKAIEEFSNGRTTFLISHSMGTIQFADRIVLIDNGRIEAVGTDQELRRGSPLYRRLLDIHYHRESA